jgi:hypothetical protein
MGITKLFLSILICLFEILRLMKAALSDAPFLRDRRPIVFTPMNIGATLERFIQSEPCVTASAIISVSAFFCRMKV